MLLNNTHHRAISASLFGIPIYVITNASIVGRRV